MASGSAILVAMWLGAVGPAVQTWSGTAPSGSCVGYRVYIDVAGTGTYYCDNGTWATVSTGGGGGGAPTTAKYLVMAADATLTQEVVVPTCAAGQHLFSNGTAISCTADSASPGSPVNSVQYNSAGAFAGSSNLTFDGTTLAFGAGLGSVAMRTVAGAVWEVGGTGKANIGSSGTGSSIELNTTGGDWVNTPNGFNSTTSNTAFQSQQAGAKWKFSLAGTNDYFYADSANGYRITTPGAIAATGGFVGNASTATILSTSGSTTQYWRGDNTWATPPTGGGGYATVQDEGVGLSAQTTLNFTGAAVTATNDAPNNRTNVTIPWPALTNVTNPTGDWTATFPSGAKALWTFTGSTDNAFSIHGDGSFTGAGDLVHIHKTGTGSTAGADALHVEVTSDTNMTGLRVTMPSSTSDAINTNGKVTASGGFSGGWATAGTTTQFWRGDNTWATPTASAAPAGSSGQIQWNNGGTTAGATNANIDSAGYFLLPAAAEPSAPANGVVVWSEPRATSAQLAYKAPLGGDDYAQGSIWNKHRAWTAPTGASAGKTDTGWATTLVGTAAASAGATTNYATAIKRLTYTSGTTASTPVEMRVSSPAFFWRGNAAGLGGFFCNFKWTNPVHNAGSDKMLVGMVNSVAALAGTTVPSAAATGQTAYAGWDAGGTAISLCGNDGTGSAGCVACNSTDFPVNSTTAVFSLSMFAAPNGSTIEMELKRLDTSVTACTRSISTAADLPANTSFLAPRIWGSNGTTAANFGLNFIGMYCETDN